jgi:AcrR family transcriptional regulator
MPDAERNTTPTRVAFRRATPQDAFGLARETFLADERVDMQTLASELGVARATLHRWVQTRESLLDRVLGDLAHDFFAASRAQVRGGPDDVIVGTVEVILNTTAAVPAIRGFVRREPEVALRLMVGQRFSVRHRLLADLQELIGEVLPEEAEQLRGFADALVQVGLAVSWPTLVAGDEPSGEQLARIARALLAGARAGELQVAVSRA